MYSYYFYKLYYKYVSVCFSWLFEKPDLSFLDNICQECYLERHSKEENLRIGDSLLNMQDDITNSPYGTGRVQRTHGLHEPMKPWTVAINTMTVFHNDPSYL